MAACARAPRAACVIRHVERHARCRDATARGHRAGGRRARGAAARPARAAGPAGLQLPLVVAAGRATSCSRRRPGALRALPAEPGTPAAGGLAPRAGARRGRRRARGSGRRARAAVRERPRAAAGARARSRPARSRSCAPSTASTSRCRSTPAVWGHWPATSSRRPPTARCRWSAVGLMYRKGYFRQRIDAGGWQHEYWVDTIPSACRRRWSPAPTAPADDRGADLRRRRSRPRSGESTSAGCRCSCSTPTARNGPVAALDHRAAVRGRSETRLAQYVLLGVGGVAALRALGIDPACCTSTRAMPRWRRWRWPAS